MNNQVRYTLKSIAKYAPFLGGLAVLLGGGIFTMASFGLDIANEAELNNYLETAIVKQATDEAAKSLANDLAQGKIDVKDFNQQFQELKLKTAQEIYKDDETFQEIIKKAEKLNRAEMIGSLLAASGAMLTAAGVFPLMFIDPGLNC